MKRTAKFSVLTATALVALASPVLAEGTISVMSFGGAYQEAQRKAVFEPYAAEKGVTVEEQEYGGEIAKIAAMIESGNTTVDVVDVDAPTLLQGCDEGIFEKIDWTQIGDQADWLEGTASDCGVGTIVYSTALAYNGATLADGPTLIADLFDTTRFPGKRGLWKNPATNLEFALLADGVPADQVYETLSTPEGVDRAFAKLDTIKDSIVWWEAGAQPLSMLQTGDVVMSTVYNGRITGLNKTEGTNMKLVWNQSIYAVDSWVILKGAENKDEGMDFIAFANAPENLSKLPAHVAYGLPVKKAAEMVDAQYAPDLPTYADNLAVSIPLNVDFWVDNSEELTERFNAWIAQ